jgi:hypothetical protein
MKKVKSFIILYSSFVILCVSTNAQWDGAEVQRLTYDDLPNGIVRIYIDEDETLHLFYLEGVRDTLAGFIYDYRILQTEKQKDGEWSQPQEIGIPEPIFGQNRHGGLWMDTRTKVVHILHSSRAGDVHDDTLYYSNSTVPDWDFHKIDSMPGQQWHSDYHSFDMDFDTLGNVHIAWHVDFDSAGTGWYKVIYANNSTGEWIKQQVSPSIFLGGVGSGPTDFSIQKNGVAHILYFGEAICGLTCESFYVKNDSLNSTTWIYDTIPRPSRPLWHYGASIVEVSVDDTVHLITGGCVSDDCVEPGTYRTFYYHRNCEGGTWHGPEQIPDTTLGSRFRLDQLVIDKDGIPYASYLLSSNEVYFTNRKLGSWQVPYALVGWQEDPDSLLVDAFSFVLDSEGQGHGVLTGWDIRQVFHNDSAETYYLSCSNSAVDTSSETSPLDFSLSQNYPNPFNSSTIIHYQTPEESNVTLRVYDILGRKVKELACGIHKRGHYRLIWDGKNNQGKEVASGIYFYMLRAGEGKEVRKMLFIK